VTAAIEARGVSKRFRLYQDKYTSLKERVIHMGKVPFEEFWALREINLAVEEGSTLGLLGRNGSGKSTLLKCIAAILQPTTGEIVVRGQVAAMLELGAGFHPELSGRDNIFLNASLLGMPRREIERRFDEIVAFAELEQFIDNQVKYYSSGMYTRLGFAVAVNVEPDVLLIDEVLAVGDEAFQRKCIERVKQFQREGRTIVLVTHAPEWVRQICDYAVVLNHGVVLAEGPPGEAIASFRDELLHGGEVAAGEVPPSPLAGGGPAQAVVLGSVEVSHPGSGSRPYMLPGEPLTLAVSFEAPAAVPDAVFTIEIHDPRGELVYGSDTDVVGVVPEVLEGPGLTTFHFESVPLLEGNYEVSLGVRSRDGGTVFDWQEHAARFSVMNPGRAAGSVALPLRAEVELARVRQRAAP
jgi:ABC-type polysaccharide/polyol phosphate transport system ATPase subunit